MKWKSNEKDQKGISLMEVLICVVVVAMVVGPMTANITTANKTITSAERLTETTSYAEALMAEVENRISADVIIKQKQDGNREMDTTGRYDNYIKNYLCDNKGFKEDLGTFLSNTNFSDEYHASAYDYEVFIWPITSGMFSLGSPIQINKTNLVNNQDKIVMLSSLGNSYDPNTFKADQHLTFQLSSDATLGDMEKAFIDTEDGYVYKSGGAANKIQVLKSKLKVDETSGAITIETKAGTNTKTEAKLTGCRIVDPDTKELTIDVKKVGAAFVTGEEASVFELDCTSLLRNLPTGAVSNYMIKITNSTGKYLSIKARKSNNAADSDASDVEKHLYVISDSPNACIEYDSEAQPEKNFLIAIIIRDKKPLIGMQGKIIKKMIDVYSYDQTINERR